MVLQQISAERGNDRVMNESWAIEILGIDHPWIKQTRSGSTGATLEEMTTLARELGEKIGLSLKTTSIHGDEISSVQSLRKLFQDHLSNKRTWMIINFDQGLYFNKASSGHFVAVTKHTHSTVRVVDPDQFASQVYDMSFEDLYTYIRTIDTSSGRDRGLLIVSDIGE